MENISQESQDIAIIGMSGRFPKSPNLESFWQNLENSNELISFFTDEELLETGIDASTLKSPNYVKAKGVIEDIECFDADLFGYHPREAECMDPQQRILLECAWATFENAGYNPEIFEGAIGVYVGANSSSYFLSNLLSHQNNSKLYDELSLLIGNGQDYLATRISYKFNLKGPSQTIQTACSTSLVTVHHACQSLLNYECDMALAGGVSVTVPKKQGYFYTTEGIYSPDGHCRAFDQKAAGTVFGDGVGLVLLKRLENAIEDGDTIHAVIKGSSINNDGKHKVGFLAPSVEGQAQVIALAQAVAGINPETILYIEAHGTGTSLGDPIEISALTQAFTRKTHKKNYCAVGSVKTNTGHLIAAAGITSLLKTVLSLKNKKIPATLHFQTPNSKLNFSTTPFYVNNVLQDWVSPYKLRAGVSSFGIGGTNAHLIVEEAPNRTFVESDTYCILPFTAKNRPSLRALLELFCSSLANSPFPLTDIAFTMQIGRKTLDERIFFISKTKNELIFQIRSYLEKGLENQGVLEYPIISDPKYQQLHQMGVLWMQGRVDWNRLHANQKRQRVPLPTYPFAKTRYWIEPVINTAFRKNEFTQMQHQVTEETLSMNMVEGIVFSLWRDILGVKKINLDDDFFAIGGDSLSALEIVDRLRYYFYLPLSIKDVFSYSTIRAFAQYIIEQIKERVPINVDSA